jgi:hypothetical protein
MYVFKHMVVHASLNLPVANFKILNFSVFHTWNYSYINLLALVE